MKIKYSIKEIEKTRKPIDTWWSVIVTDPISVRVLWFFANFSKITPNKISVIGFLLGLLSAYLFYQGSYIYLIVGAIIYELSFLFDCMDGKLSRLKNYKSNFGKFLDNMLDEWKFIFNLLGLTFGQYLITNNNLYLMLGVAYTLIVSYDKFLCSTEDSMKKPSMQTINSKLPKDLLSRVRYFFESRRLLFGITRVELNTLIFFVFPLLNLIKIGFIFNMLLVLPWLLFRIYRFSLYLKKMDAFSK